MDLDNIKRKPFGTMGLPRRRPLPSPTDFLKKQGGVQFKIPAEGARCLNLQKRPPVPTKDALLAEEKAKQKGPKKNFLANNVRNVVGMKPVEPEPKIVIDRFGITKKMSAGMEPRYIYSKTFGKTPPYLAHFIKVKEQSLLFKRDTHGTEQPKCRYITRVERDDLLAGLKENWEELQQIYQGLPILTDTIPKVQRKSKLESALKQLEKDIVLLERHPYIYVYNDNEITA